MLRLLKSRRRFDAGNFGGIRWFSSFIFTLKRITMRFARFVERIHKRLLRRRGRIGGPCRCAVGARLASNSVRIQRNWRNPGYLTGINIWFLPPRVQLRTRIDGGVQKDRELTFFGLGRPQALNARPRERPQPRITIHCILFGVTRAQHRIPARDEGQLVPVTRHTCFKTFPQIYAVRQRQIRENLHS